MKNSKFRTCILLVALCIGVVFQNQMSVWAAPTKMLLTKLTFDAEYYYNTYADLQEAIGWNEVALYKHYIQFGLKEGRFGSEEFNCAIYMSNYADLRVAFRADYEAYCVHYERYGKAEGRSADVQLDNGTISAVINGKVLGSYATDYDTSVPRATNIAIAASRINGVVVQPGEEFSFSQTVLPRTPEFGYVEAPEIAGGRMTNGYGGGICQVSSTLYAAMLSAGISATERHPHSAAVSYIPKDMDATIATPYKDLKFTNVFEKPIQIMATTEESGRVTVSIALMK